MMVYDKTALLCSDLLMGTNLVPRALFPGFEAEWALGRENAPPVKLGKSGLGTRLHGNHDHKNFL